jgi:MOSC domain-containing protein
MTPVGKILKLARYPVKSMRGETLDATSLTLQGLPDDRRYAFVQKNSRSAFPWLTARELPELLRYQPRVTHSSGQATDPKGLAVSVVTPSGDEWPVDSEELRRELEVRFGQPLYLLRDYRGFFDVAPIGHICRQTVAAIAAESSTKENFLRFRPNFLIDLENGSPFEELKWVGKILRIGQMARVAITEPDQRCVMITLDPESTESNPAILKCVVQRHNRCAGVYGTVLTPGEVRTGDDLWIEN